jgi:hypothetical protein
VLEIAPRSRLLSPPCSIRVRDRPKLKKKESEQRRAKKEIQYTHSENQYGYPEKCIEDVGLNLDS